MSLWVHICVRLRGVLRSTAPQQYEPKLSTDAETDLGRLEPIEVNGRNVQSEVMSANLAVVTVFYLKDKDPHLHYIQSVLDLVKAKN
eukprot:gene23596-185_t